MENISDFHDYINSMVIAYDTDSCSDYNEYAHDCSEGCQYTVCYHSAWDLVELVKRYNSPLFYEGEEMAMNTFDPKHSSLDNLITSVASGIIYTAMLDAFNKQEQEG